MGHNRHLFLYFYLFYIQLTAIKCLLKVAYDWNRTHVFWFGSDDAVNCAMTTAPRIGNVHVLLIIPNVGLVL